MLKCNEPTMSCICSSVGRLTVDMGPPNDVALAGAAGADFRDGATRGPFGAETDARPPFVGRTAPLLGEATGSGPFARGALAVAGGGASRELPRPTRSAMAPARTALESSSRI